MVPRMLEKYKKEISPALLKEFGYKNVMQLPRVEKVVVNIGVGDAKLDIKFMDAAIAELRAITGQQPLLKRAKKSVADFKVREGMPVACSGRSGEPVCGSSWIASSPSRCPASRTSRGFPAGALTGAAITTSAFGSS